MNGWKTLFAWTCAATLIALCVARGAVVEWTNANAGLSSWVQASGSIAAICIAIWVAGRQHRESIENLDRAASRRRLEAVSGVVAIGQHCLVQIEQVLAELRKPRTGDRWALDGASLKRLQWAVSRIHEWPLNELPNHHVVEALLIFDECADRVLLLLQREAEWYDMAGDAPKAHIAT